MRPWGPCLPLTPAPTVQELSLFHGPAGPDVQSPQHRAQPEPSRWHLRPRNHGHGAARTACAGCLPPPRALRHRGGRGGAAARGGGASAAIGLLQPDSGMTG